MATVAEVHQAAPIIESVVELAERGEDVGITRDERAVIQLAPLIARTARVFQLPCRLDQVTLLSVTR